MTISTQDSKINYNGNGITTVFDVPFPFLEKDQIYVQKKLADGTLQDLTIGTDYSVYGEGEETGGRIEMTTAPETGSSISIYRNVPLTQEVDYRENEIFPAETHEEALDKLTMEVQQIQEQLDRSVKVDRFSDVDPDKIVAEIERVYDSTDNIDIVATNIESVKTDAENIAAINTVANNIADVNTVASISADVLNVSGIKDDVSTVALIKDDVSTVAGIDGSVSIVADIRNDVVSAAANNDNITTVSDNISNVNIVAGISQNVSDVADIKDNVTTVAENKLSVNEVAAIKDEVKAVGDNISAVSNVSSNMTNVLNVDTNMADVKTVAGIEAQVKNVSTNMHEVVVVSDDIANVNTVATNDAAIKTIGEHIDVVLKAPDYANNAKVWSEGTDEEVAKLGGVHSAEEWAKIAGQAAQVDIATETTAGIIRIATPDEAEGGIVDAAAMTPLKTKYVADDYTGKGLQLGFNGTLTGGVLTFMPDETAYTLKQGYDYEIDLLFPAAGILPDDTQMIITNGSDTVQIVNVRHADASSSITYGDMKQICRYDADVGWRWVFNARYAVTDTGVKVFVMPSYAFQDDRYVTTDTAQNITAGKNFVNSATSTDVDSHTSMSICLKNSEAELGADTQNEDGTVNFKYQGIRVVDKNNEEISSLYTAPDGVGGSFTRLSASAKVDDQYVDGFVELEVDANGKTHFYVPDVDEDSTVNGTQATTKKYVDGDQTITGVKTFTNIGIPISIERDTNQQEVPSTSTYTTVGLYKNKTYTKGDGYSSWLSCGRTAEGHTFTGLSARRFLESDGTEIVSTLSIKVSKNGETYATAPTPNITSTGNIIATCGYINTKFQVVSALPASPNTNVFYFIPE